MLFFIFSSVVSPGKPRVTQFFMYRRLCGMKLIAQFLRSAMLRAVLLESRAMRIIECCPATMWGKHRE